LGSDIELEYEYPRLEDPDPKCLSISIKAGIKEGEASVKEL
jgi:hypothetical protein